MARQIPSTDLAEEALKNHDSYYKWLCMQSGLEGPLAELFFTTDFRWVDNIVDDANRALEAKDLREQYAIYLLAGDKASSAIFADQWHDIDRLKKSVIGPSCVFEVLICLARELDSMLNMEPESQIKKYFSVLMNNAGFDFYDEEDWDSDSEKVEKYWKKVLDRVLDRTYSADGKGGLFPLKEANAQDSGEYISGQNQLQRSLWEQMQYWADEEMESMDSDF